MPASIFEQGVPVRRVADGDLMPGSPRNYNATIADHEGKRWLAYRAHRMEEAGRCGIAIAEVADGKGSPVRVWPSQWLDLPRPTGGEHHEDPRLFVHAGALHVAYVESRFHVKRNYTCRLGYARLARKGGRWVVAGTWFPRWGDNDGEHQEKNWSFFSSAGRLLAIYQGEPHTVLEIEGDVVRAAHEAPAGKVCWPWGQVRGGTPPVRMEDGRWLTMFHSSRLLPTVKAPHWRRYYAAAYVFEPEPPYRIVAMSQRPLLAGSEADGHAEDPRRSDSWKPFVVFPGGMVPAERPGAWLVAYGVNDYFSVLAEHTELALGDPSFAGWGARYFLTENASLPVRVKTDLDRGGAEFMHWRRLKRPVGGLLPGAGILEVTQPERVELVEERPGVTEIPAERYRELAAVA